LTKRVALTTVLHYRVDCDGEFASRKRLKRLDERWFRAWRRLQDVSYSIDSALFFECKGDTPKVFKRRSRFDVRKYGMFGEL